MKIFAFAMGALALGSVSAFAEQLSVFTTTNAKNNLETMVIEGGLTRDLTIGLGSAAFRHPSDPANMIYGVGDRGPNFTCKAAKKVTGIDGKEICGDRKVRIYATPDYSPSIYTMFINEDGSFDIKDVITIKGQDGVPVNGMLNPLKSAATERPVDITGAELPQSASAVDLEGIIRLSDGTFWLSEENGPSLLHVKADGRVIKRMMPEGTQGDLKTASYPVVGGLPKILYKRQTNRGFESLALSPDESKMYVIVQNPLAHPDKAAYEQAQNTRLLVLDMKTEDVIGEYVYQLTPFTDWTGEKPLKKQSTQRISEMLALGDDRLVVLERTNKITKLYEISLDGATNILGTKWDDMTTSPSLEQTNDVASIGITATPKTLVWDSAKYPEAPVKIEGLAVLGDGSIAMINDNDFGIGGLETKILVLKNSKIKADKALHMN